MEANPYGVIYCLTCKVNGKVYIGQTINFNKRMIRYKNLHCKEQPKIYNALKKYGVENFNYEIIDIGLSKADLDQLECYHMTLADSRNTKFGYNCKEGGGNGKQSEESNKKNSESQKGKIRTKEHCEKLSKANKGQKRSEEAKKNMSIARKKMVRTPHTEETKLKISIANIGKKVSEDSRKKMSESQKKRKNLPKQYKE